MTSRESKGVNSLHQQRREGRRRQRRRRRGKGPWRRKREKSREAKRRDEMSSTTGCRSFLDLFQSVVGGRGLAKTGLRRGFIKLGKAGQGDWSLIFLRLNARRFHWSRRAPTHPPTGNCQAPASDSTQRRTSPVRRAKETLFKLWAILVTTNLRPGSRRKAGKAMPSSSFTHPRTSRSRLRAPPSVLSSR
jgi:hypothetical protein